MVEGLVRLCQLEGLSALSSLFCQVWAGEIITCDNSTTLRNKVDFFSVQTFRPAAGRLDAKPKGLLDKETSGKMILHFAILL